MDYIHQGSIGAHPHGCIPLENEYHFLPAASSTQAHTAQFYAYNTMVTIQAYGEKESIKQACHHVFELCRTFEYLFSRTIQSSDICRIHISAPKWVSIHPFTYDLLTKSIMYCRQSCNTFDITMGSVCSLWDFNREIIPDANALSNALAHVDISALELKEANNMYWARLNDPYASLDVGGTAKGYIADKIGTLLSEHGIAHYLINLGGNVLVHGGKPSGLPYIIGIKDPTNPQSVLLKVPIVSGSVVTSGLYERAFISNGLRYAHILSPQTGLPITTDVESVTVIAPYSADCDGYSTTLCALGIKQGIAFAQQCPAIQCAIFIDDSNSIYVSNPEFLEP